MSELIFYTNPMSRGQIVRWALHEAGAEYRQEIIDYGPAMKSAPYIDINPMGKVPAIVHHGKAITECAAICAYLADAFPEAGLAPEAEQRQDYYRWLFFASGPLENAILNNSLGFHTNDEQTRTAGYGSYDLVVNVLDDFLTKQDYVCGENFTMADVYLGSQVDWGVMFKTLPERDSFLAYAERLRARAKYQEAKAIDADLIAKMNA